MILSRRTRVAAWLAMAGLIGCHAPSDATGLEPSALALYIGEVRLTRFSSLALFPGTELHFTVRLTDPAGRPVTDLHAQIVSRSSGTLSVDSAGVVRVAGLGASWIVGSVLTHARAVLADSVFVNVVCTLQSQPAVLLTVMDSISGRSDALRNVNISIRDGARRDTVFISSAAAFVSPIVVGMANERKGTYDLTVTADGHLPWSRTGVVVSGDVCHVTPVPLTAKLQPV